VEGLGIFKGCCIRFDEKNGLKIPQIGWNSLSFTKRSRLFDGLNDNPYVYFVHSYYVKAEDESIVAATADYGNVFHAACEHNNVFGCQFHPEKSSEVGLSILKNFVKATKE
jgi:glutamine amidotransferase